MKRIIASAIFAVFSLGAYASLWHFPLYLDGGTPAKNRLQVEVSNIGEIDAVGGEFKISAKELGLVGKNIKSIRILSENNRELLWSVQPETKKLKKNSQFIIPVDCKVGKTTKIWVYYNNPTAYEVPDYYVSTKNFSDSFEKYDSVLILSHFKGHAMGGFGGALKNMSIGIALIFFGIIFVVLLI